MLADLAGGKGMFIVFKDDNSRPFVKEDILQGDVHGKEGNLDVLASFLRENLSAQVSLKQSVVSGDSPLISSFGNQVIRWRLNNCDHRRLHLVKQPFELFSGEHDLLILQLKRRNVFFTCLGQDFLEFLPGEDNLIYIQFQELTELVPGNADLALVFFFLLGIGW